LTVERIEGDPEADEAQIVILIFGHGLDAGHPTARPVEPDCSRLVAASRMEPLFVRLPAVPQIVDGLEGGGTQRAERFTRAACQGNHQFTSEG